MSFLFGLLVALALVYRPSSQENCMTQSLNGALITKPDVALKGHIRKSLQAVSFIQCGLRCQQQKWCISINFQMSKPTGVCELNDFGVEDDTNFWADRFDERKGFVYSQLKPADVSIFYFISPTKETDCHQYTRPNIKPPY
jgi:hypothetical protein